MYSESEVISLLRKPLVFTVSDIFEIPNRGTVLVGTVNAGVAKINQKLSLKANPSMTLEVSFIEVNRVLQNEAYLFETAGLFFKDKYLTPIKSGDILHAV